METKETSSKIKDILLDMGNSQNLINDKTNLKSDLDFDILDLADFLIRIEEEF